MGVDAREDGSRTGAEEGRWVRVDWRVAVLDSGMGTRGVDFTCFHWSALVTDGEGVCGRGAGNGGPNSTFVRIWRAQRRNASSTLVPSNALASKNPIPKIIVNMTSPTRVGVRPQNREGKWYPLVKPTVRLLRRKLLVHDEIRRQLHLLENHLRRI